jgi:hypothetical protein
MVRRSKHRAKVRVARTAAAVVDPAVVTPAPAGIPPGEERPGDAGASEAAADQRWLEGALILGLVLAAVGLQAFFFRSSGAVWRDEASTLLVASAPTLGRLWDWLAKDSAPALFYLLVRLWGALGPQGDAWLRLLGAAVWCGMIASLVVSCRTLTGRLPVVALPLVAFNPTLFYYGSSMRAYGLAVALIVACSAALWRVVREPSRPNIAAGLLLATLACHASYQNSYVLLAIGTAAALACAVCRLWRRAVLVLAIGGVAGLSMAVYWRIILEYRDGAGIARFDIPLATIRDSLVEAVGANDSRLFLLAATLGAAAIACLIVRVVRGRAGARRAPSLDLYMLAIVVIAAGAGGTFIRSYGTFPNPWHFMPLIAMAAVAIEVALRPTREVGPAARGRLELALAIAAASLLPVWRAAHYRRTSLDRMAALLETRAAPDDLILVNPFWLAPGFRYHYHGRTEWNTLPLTSSALEASIFPFAPIKEVMTRPDSIRPTLAKIETTLSRGNRLWLVGGIEIPKPDLVPLELAPAPGSPYGWNSIVYTISWTQHVGVLLARHMERAERVPLDVPQPVNGYEDPMLMVIAGWRTEPRRGPG